MNKKFYRLSPQDLHIVKKLKGPIVVFGAGGFIGINLLESLCLYRNDVFGISQNPDKNWRIFKSHISKKFFLPCDITRRREMAALINKLKPQTVFNLAAYGAYEHQSNIDNIYATNFIATVALLEQSKRCTFSAYVHAGSSSEYGEQANGPDETTLPKPNSHYAVSKAAVASLLQYYGKKETLPVIYLRFYSVYGPYEEPTRLIPTVLAHAMQKTYPHFAAPSISRDFVYVRDVVSACIKAAGNKNPSLWGETFNVGTGTMTTIRDLSFLVKTLTDIPTNPQFGTFPKRIWDHTNDWYASIGKIKKQLGWKPQTSLATGLQETLVWQKTQRL